ncbi:MAG: cation:proton antiporter [Ignavibacteria bacterium]|nr:cation:proton antiporter [Ignavibacteria bacterium]
MLNTSDRHIRLGAIVLATFLVGLILHVSVGTGISQSNQPSLPNANSTASPTEDLVPPPQGDLTPGQQHETRETEHSDPFTPILLEFALIILAAVFGRWAAEKLHIAPVLGELLIGVIVGNIGYWLRGSLFVVIMHLDSTLQIFGLIWDSSLSVREAAPLVFSANELAPGGIGDQIVAILSHTGAGRVVSMSYAIWLFSNLGVILLLFMVGYETSVEEMLGVGAKALVVAIVGIIAPFLLGFGVGSVLLPEASTPTLLFLGATLSATSVGITARVFRDLGRLQTREAKIILGAAVIDDILGLIILAIVVGIVATGEVQLGEVGRILLMAAAFLAIVIFWGEKIFHWIISKTGRFERRSIKLLYPLMLAFLMAWVSSVIGLASIVGAFAAGLLLKEELFKHDGEEKQTVAEIIGPLEKLFAPVFFVLMGLQVNLQSFLQADALLLALAFIIAAILGKVICGYSIGGVDKLSIGIGMVPRGEVGLIFASIGKGLGVVSDAVFSAVVTMVIVTTFVAPFGLKWSLSRKAVSQTDDVERK